MKASKKFGRWGLWLALAGGLAFPAAASPFRTEIQVGFPHFFALRVDRSIAPQWNVGLTAGWLPLSALTALYQPQIQASISDDHSMTVEPGLQVFTTGLFGEWQTASGGSFFRVELLLNTVSGQARSYLNNLATGAKAPYMDMQLTANLPRLVLGYGFRFSKGEKTHWSAGVGVTVLIANSVTVENKGPWAAYYESVPALRASVQDGLGNVESELRSLVSANFAAARVLPAAWVSASW